MSGSGAPKYRPYETMNTSEYRMKFFIMGSQRSGTTLLGMIMDVHPDVSVIDENDQDFHYQGPVTLLLDFTKAKECRHISTQMVGFKIPRDTHRVEELFETIPQAKIIWISRRIKPVVASMCELSLDGTNSWALTHAPREIQKYLKAYPADLTLAKYYAITKELPVDRYKELSLATICWVVKEKSKRYMERRFGNSMLFIDYYDLISNAGQISRKICLFLGLEWTERLLRHHEFGQGARIGGNCAEYPINKDNDLKWQSTLSVKDEKIIDDLMRSIYQHD